MAINNFKSGWNTYSDLINTKFMFSGVFWVSEMYQNTGNINLPICKLGSSS